MDTAARTDGCLSAAVWTPPVQYSRERYPGL